MVTIDYAYSPGTPDSGKARWGAVSAKTRELLERAAELANQNLDQKITTVRIFSGGQVAGNSSSSRPYGGTGSIRHDLGGAGDVHLIGANGERLYYTTPAGKASFNAFAKAAASLGATGIGMGPGYMGNGTIHVGFGDTATWGGMPSALKTAIAEGWKNPVSDQIKWTRQDEALGQINRLGFASVKDFQKAYGIPADGVLGPQTMTKAWTADKTATGAQVASLATMTGPGNPVPPMDIPNVATAQAPADPTLHGYLGLPRNPPQGPVSPSYSLPQIAGIPNVNPGAFSPPRQVASAPWSAPMAPLGSEMQLAGMPTPRARPQTQMAQAPASSLTAYAPTEQYKGFNLASPAPAANFDWSIVDKGYSPAKVTAPAERVEMKSFDLYEVDEATGYVSKTGKQVSPDVLEVLEDVVSGVPREQIAEKMNARVLSELMTLDVSVDKLGGVPLKDGGMLPRDQMLGMTKGLLEEAAAASPAGMVRSVLSGAVQKFTDVISLARPTTTEQDTWAQVGALEPNAVQSQSFGAFDGPGLTPFAYQDPQSQIGIGAPKPVGQWDDFGFQPPAAQSPAVQAPSPAPRAPATGFSGTLGLPGAFSAPIGRMVSNLAQAASSIPTRFESPQLFDRSTPPTPRSRPQPFNERFGTPDPAQIRMADGSRPVRTSSEGPDPRLDARTITSPEANTRPTLSGGRATANDLFNSVPSRDQGGIWSAPAPRSVPTQSIGRDTEAMRSLSTPGEYQVASLSGGQGGSDLFAKAPMSAPQSFSKPPSDPMADMLRMYAQSPGDIDGIAPQMMGNLNTIASLPQMNNVSFPSPAPAFTAPPRTVASLPATPYSPPPAPVYQPTPPIPQQRPYQPTPKKPGMLNNPLGQAGIGLLMGGIPGAVIAGLGSAIKNQPGGIKGMIAGWGPTDRTLREGSLGLRDVRTTSSAVGANGRLPASGGPIYAYTTGVNDRGDNVTTYRDENGRLHSFNSDSAGSLRGAQDYARETARARGY